MVVLHMRVLLSGMSSRSNKRSLAISTLICDFSKQLQMVEKAPATQRQEQIGRSNTITQEKPFQNVFFSFISISIHGCRAESDGSVESELEAIRFIARSIRHVQIVFELLVKT